MTKKWQSEDSAPAAESEDEAEITLAPEEAATVTEEVGLEAQEEASQKLVAVAPAEEEEEREIEMPAALSMEWENEEPAAPALELGGEEEEPAPALAEVEAEAPAATAEPSLSLEGEEGAEEPATASLPEGLQLQDIAAPGDNLTAGLEEINLSDLMPIEGEAGEADFDLELDNALELGEEADDEEVEKIFDLSDITAGEEAASPTETEQEQPPEPAIEKETAVAAKEAAAPTDDEKILDDFDMDLDLELEDE